MPSKKLITLLQTFSSHELSRFERYLYSPFFNENEALQELYHLILKIIQNSEKHKEDSVIQKQFIWKQLFKNEPYEDGQMRRILSELTQQALHFLIIERFQKKRMEEHIYLLDIFKERNLSLHFNATLRHIENLQEKSASRNFNYHLQQHQIENIHHKYIEKSGHKIEDFSSFNQANYHLDCYYIVQKLKYFCDTLGYRDFFSIELRIDLLPDFLTFLPNSIYIQEPTIYAYFLASQMLIHPEDESFFFTLRQHLQQFSKAFEDFELRELYVHLLNYCIYKKINIGKLEFFGEVFSILKKMLEEDLAIENGILPDSYYKLIITVGLQVKEFAWTETFIQEYTPKLPPDERENALTYNLAKVYFAQNQYEKVIEQLREVEYDNLTYALGGKLMLLKTYYELNEYLALDSLIDSFRVYLRRNQTISKEVRQQYLNVLRFIKKLSNIHLGDQEAIAKVEQQIQACKNLADKGWIVQKVEELKNG